jgi:uncharacterized repeat protein (TIGR01451 family)
VTAQILYAFFLLKSAIDLGFKKLSGLPLMISFIRSQKIWFQLLTAGVVVGSMLQSTSVLAQKVVENQLSNQASYTYTDSASGREITGISSQVVNTVSGILDPFGRITGCGGEVLTNYTGFSMNLYESDPSDPTGTEIKDLVQLTKTEVPDIPGNALPLGLAPNIENSNPFFLTNGNNGTYNFLLDPTRGQLDPGKTYILLINPPPDSNYDQRRIRLTIRDRQGSIVSYTATSLDGKPLSSTDDRTSMTQTVNIQDAERIGLSFAVVDVNSTICQAEEVQIVKTGDRAVAQPGDTVIYRLSVRNLASSSLNNVVISDTLPLGFNFVPKSVRATVGDSPVKITTSHNNSTISLRAEGLTLPGGGSQDQVLNIAYAAVLTADSVRGSGENSAIINAQRLDNNQSVKDGPAIHRLRIDPGILSDCGTLIGRVFEDKNFDGEQQTGEPGIPNAVVFMDDGNRITTDTKGLFSVANVISGYRTGVLDLTSVPGYNIAPNRKFSERNSQSRLVQLEPGGLARMNFAVTPLSQEGNKK